MVFDACLLLTACQDLSSGISLISLIQHIQDNIVLSLFQMVRNFNVVKEQYIAIAPLAKKVYLIGPTGLAAGIRLPDAEIIEITGSGLEKNWLIIRCGRRRLRLSCQRN
jgi:hypothetical protein